MQKNIKISVVTDAKDKAHVEIESDFSLQQTLNILVQTAKLMIVETPNVKSNYSS